MERKAQIERKTEETDIKIEFNIDGSGYHKIHTSIAFLDHLLTQVAVHGTFNLTITANGDLSIDNHHLIEDVGIGLGKAFKVALGEKKGVSRIGSCFFPMDDSLAFVAIDLSSRPYLVTDIKWINPFIGSREDNIIPVELIEHFLYSFAIQAELTLHVRLLYGQNNHHIAEAIFKALGKALDQASRIDSKRLNFLPSSKGVL
jgi:imidazoleglycerol-phosphate dehydratase